MNHVGQLSARELWRWLEVVGDGGARRDRTADLNTASVSVQSDRNTNQLELEVML